MTQNLGRLEEVPLRNVWEAEDRNFTPWLAQEENLSLLSDTLGIELELESTEKSVGPFKADILCKDTGNDTWVLIENQLERTDHTHLGQLMTYSSGLDAATIVWIAQRFTEEHRSALDWLNNITDERFRFFGLEIQAWKIGDSNIAPKFNIISQPNNWVKDVKEGARTHGTLSQNQQLQLDFWTQLRQRIDENPVAFKWSGGRANTNWINIGLGKTGFSMDVNLIRHPTDRDKKDIRVGLYLNNDSYYNWLLERKELITSSLPNYDLEWADLPERTGCRIFTAREAEFSNKDNWPEYCEWLVNTLNDFHSFFSPLVKEYS